MRSRPAHGNPARRRLLRILSALAVPALAAAGCGDPPPADGGAVRERWTIAGATMGTTFAVTVAAARGGGGAQAVEADVRRVLERIEGRMSHYRPESELSRFNRARTTEPRPLSAETLGVVAEALAVGRQSGGAFDVTVGPLVDAWGFGPPGRMANAPDGAALAALRERVGVDLLKVDRTASTLRKRRADVVVDLSAIAKGYAVDAVSALLAEGGFGDHLVEIGGELRAAGGNEFGRPWRVAIERPETGGVDALRIVPLTDAAVATSGDYRNFYALDGARIAHLIDPRTGRPVTHGLRAVSVIAERCAVADARATALHVLGPDEGYALAAAEGWAALFVVDDAGRLVERETPAFTAAVRRGAGASQMPRGGTVGAASLSPDGESGRRWTDGRHRAPRGS